MGDRIGDDGIHGGDDQAVYAVAREVLDHWQVELAREIPDGGFGENLTTAGVDVDGAVIGERWRVGRDARAPGDGPAYPVRAFREWIGIEGWLRRFTLDARPGSYLRVLQPGSVAAGRPVEVAHRPDHGITVSFAFRARVLEPGLLPPLRPALADLDAESAPRRGRPYRGPADADG